MVTWTILICGFCEVRKPLAAKELFFYMKGHDQVPSLHTCAVVLDGLFKCWLDSEVVSLFTVMEKSGLDLDIVIYNIILDGMCKE